MYLANGAKILAVDLAINSAGLMVGTVLARRVDGAPDQWVTWSAESRPEGNMIECSNGHYFVQKADALDDYNLRRGRLKQRPVSTS